MSRKVSGKKARKIIQMRAIGHRSISYIAQKNGIKRKSVKAIIKGLGI